MDGPQPNVDIDYQVDTGTLTAMFSGFESEAHGIHHIEFCVGTRPGWDNIVPYSSQGVIVEESPEEDVIGEIKISMRTFIYFHIINMSLLFIFYPE